MKTSNITTKQQIETLTSKFGAFAVSLMTDEQMQMNLVHIKENKLVTLKDKNTRANVTNLIIEKLDLKLEKDVSTRLPY